DISLMIRTQSQQLEAMVGKLGGLRQEKTQVLATRAARQKLEADAERLAPVKLKLKLDIENRDKAQAAYQDAAAMAGAGKSEGLVHDLARALALMLQVCEGASYASDPFDAEHIATAALNSYQSKHGPLDQAEGDPE